MVDMMEILTINGSIGLPDMSPHTGPISIRFMSRPLKQYKSYRIQEEARLDKFRISPLWIGGVLI
jgi:hypothetical protein